MSTILKWAGNKTAIMPELKKYLPAGPRLVEPFAGYRSSATAARL